MPEQILAVTDLRKEYQVARAGSLRREPFVAVDGVTFAVSAGGSLAVVGESGSGKTTCARMVVGLERPTSGTITVAGRLLGTGRIGRRERMRRGRVMQMVFQDPYLSLDRHQTVRQCLAEALSLYFPADRAERERRVDELLEQVGLDSRQGRARPGALSGGQRQRVAIARALAAQPQLLILDEAVAALDVSIQAQVLNLLMDIRSQSEIALLFISHDLSVVKQLCDEVIVMRDGHVVERGHVADVLDRPEQPYTRQLLDSAPRPGWKPKRRGARLVT